MRRSARRGRAVSLVVAGFLGAGAACTPAPVTGHWEQTTPVAGGGELFGVSCVTDTWCLAVGQIVAGERVLPLVQQWDGASWTRVAAPPDPGGAKVYLDAVSCSAVDRCLAVGVHDPDVDTAPVVARWNGTDWNDETDAVRGLLLRPFGVSCNASGCAISGVRAGEHPVFGDVVAQQAAQVIVSTGAGWSALPEPPVQIPYLSHRMPQQAMLSCPTLTFCGLATWTATVWDGTRWSAPASSLPRDPSTTTYSGYRDISCAAVGRCVAVGSTHPGTGAALADFRGGRWRPQTMVNSAQVAVSCATIDLCLTLAGIQLPWYPDEKPLEGLERRGTSWLPLPRGDVPPQPPAGTRITTLSCTRGGCMAVGGVFTGTPALAYRWTF